MKTTIFFTALLMSICFLSIAQEKEKEEITQMLDNWHKAAANTDQTAYFDGIDENGIYIGTDATEIWTKQEFFEWSKPYFDKGKAWGFTAIKRNIYLSEDHSFAWFDELLQFTGGVFRGSGVVMQERWPVENKTLCAFIARTQ